MIMKEYTLYRRSRYDNYEIMLLTPRSETNF